MQQKRRGQGQDDLARDDPSDRPALPLDAIVIRGGRAIQTSRARLNAMDVYEKTGTWGICAASRPDMTADDIARQWTYTGDFYSISTVRAIRALGPGFDVVADMGQVHAVIVLPRAPHRNHQGDDLWRQLQSAFVASPVGNPRRVPREETFK